MRLTSIAYAHLAACDIEFLAPMASRVDAVAQALGLSAQSECPPRDERDARNGPPPALAREIHPPTRSKAKEGMALARSLPGVWLQLKAQPSAYAVLLQSISTLGPQVLAFEFFKVSSPQRIIEQRRVKEYPQSFCKIGRQASPLSLPICRRKRRHSRIRLRKMASCQERLIKTDLAEKS